MFIKTCSNIQVLSTDEQRTLMTRFVSTSLWPLVELGRADSIDTMIKKVGEAYYRQVPKFARKVKFHKLMINKGENYVHWSNRINQPAKLADLEGIKAQDLQLMKFCHGLNKTHCLYDKLMDMEVHSWATAQEIIKKYSQSQALRADLVESAPKSQGHIVNQMSGSGGSAPRPPARLRGRRERNMIRTTGAGTGQRLILAMEGGKVLGGAKVIQEFAGAVMR